MDAIQRIYLDYSATTPLDSRVLDVMMPFFSDQFGNSMAVHGFGRDAERAIEHARETVARCLNCQPREVIFTSGGTESDNLALRGPAQMARAEGRAVTLVTCPVEHHAISVTARQLCATLGASLRIVPVDHFGQVSPGDLRALLHNLPPDGVTIVSLIHTNNEIGTSNPIAECAAVAHEFGAIMHTDAVQSPASVALDVAAWGVDMLSLSSHKFYGPKGSGVLVLRDGVPFLSASSGAKHEDHRRAGTHNTPGIVGTAHALDLVCDALPENAARLAALRDRLVAGVLEHIPNAELTGHPTNRLPGHASFAFKDIESTTLLMHLDQHGIAASSGSACKVGNEKPSTLLETLGYGPEWTRGGLRLTLGHNTTESDIDAVLDVLPAAVDAVRRVKAMSVFREP